MLDAAFPERLVGAAVYYAQPMIPCEPLEAEQYAASGKTGDCNASGLPQGIQV
jgi:hypothetical protein